MYGMCVFPWFENISPSQYQLIGHPAGLGVFVKYGLAVHIDVAGDEPVGASPHHHVLPPHRPVVVRGDVVRQEGGGRPLSAGQARTPGWSVTGEMKGSQNKVWSLEQTLPPLQPIWKRKPSGITRKLKLTKVLPTCSCLVHVPGHSALRSCTRKFCTENKVRAFTDTIMISLLFMMISILWMVISL